MNILLREYLKQAIGAFIRVYGFLPDELQELLSELEDSNGRRVLSCFPSSHQQGGDMDMVVAKKKKKRVTKKKKEAMVKKKVRKVKEGK